MIVATRSIVQRFAVNGIGRPKSVLAKALRNNRVVSEQQRLDPRIKDSSYLSYYDRMYTRRDQTLAWSDSRMIPCDLCGSDKAQLVLESTNLDGPLVKCSSCGLYYVGSRRSGLTFGADTAENVVNRVRQANVGFQNLRLEEEHRLALLNARWRLDLIREYKPSGRLLEVGCARGDFLVAKQTFDVFGVEPNPELAASVEKVAPVHAGVIETLTADNFDVAASFHVIEHVDSPRRFLQAMVNRVKPRGLVVLETPNIRSIPFNLLKSRWRQFIPEHYFFFDPTR